mgnify:CR=1 FL=1
MNNEVRIGLIAGATILAGLCTTQCNSKPATTTAIEDASVDSIKQDGNLIVLTLEGPTTFSATTEGAIGYESDLVTAFADDLGVTPRFIQMDSIDELLDAMEEGRGHLAAANLTMTDARTDRLSFGPAYKNVEDSVVCHQKGPAPTTIKGLAEVDLTVLRGSSYDSTLQTLKKDHPDLEWKTALGGSALPMLRDVAERRLDCTVADSHLAEYARRLYPDLVIPMSLTEARPLGWVYNDSIAGMDQALAAWFMEAHASGYLEELDEHWFGHLDEFDYVEVLRFVERVDERLPRYRTYFEAAADKTEFDWHLLAAQAYQESHWDAEAVSPTGVRGIMMLTRPTAKEVGVDNRLDPAQSVDGGARYLQRLYNRLPEGIDGQDRLWFALAAYNVGMGHIYDARTLARRQGLDPNQWQNVERMLPLLTRPKYYKSVKHGYARGYEPVRYVERIRDYYNMLRANVPV